MSSNVHALPDLRKRRNRRSTARVLGDLLAAAQGREVPELDRHACTVVPTRGHAAGTLCLVYKNGDTYYLDIAHAEYE